MEVLCSYVCACADLVAPYNIIDLLHPYTHLLDDSVMKQKTYIAGVTNPIFKSKTKNWDVFCDIVTGEIIENGLY